MKEFFIIFYVFFICPFMLKGQENLDIHNNVTRDSLKFIFLSDVKCQYPLLDDSKKNKHLEDLFLKIREEEPDFVFINGFVGEQLGKCVINESVKYHAKGYYPLWLDIIKKSGLDYFTVIGPDVFGGKDFDNQKRILFDLYGDEYDKYLRMPYTGGGEKKKGKFYWHAANNVLMVVLDAYENPVSIDGKLVPNISSEQLTWLENTLEGHSQYDNKMVIASTSSLLKSNKELTAILSKNKIDYFISFESDSFLKEKLYDFNVVTIPKSILPNENCQYVKFDVNKNQVDINLIEQNNTGKIPKL